MGPGGEVRERQAGMMQDSTAVRRSSAGHCELLQQNRKQAARSEDPDLIISFKKDGDLGRLDLTVFTDDIEIDFAVWRHAFGQSA
jgi:hypothetical protein